MTPDYSIGSCVKLIVPRTAGNRAIISGYYIGLSFGIWQYTGPQSVI